MAPVAPEEATDEPPGPEDDVEQVEHEAGGAGEHDEPGLEVDVGGGLAPVAVPVEAEAEADPAPHRVPGVILHRGGRLHHPPAHLGEHDGAGPGEEPHHQDRDAHQGVDQLEQGGVQLAAGLERARRREKEHSPEVPFQRGQ